MSTIDTLARALRELIGCAEPHRDRVEIKAARDALRAVDAHNPCDEFHAHCMTQAAQPGPAREFWQRLAGSVRKARTL